jgi:multisubunit Na+/H+ antiporter MnhG subunit
MKRLSARATYFWLMGTCVGLIVVAWNVVRFWSVPAAVVMSAVAAVIPPVAAMLAGRGRGGG